MITNDMRPAGIAVAVLAAGLALTPAALAQGVQKDVTQDMQLNADVPSEYMLSIPARTDITFEQESTPLSGLRVTGNVATDETVEVTADVNGGKLLGDSPDKALPFTLADAASGISFTAAQWDTDELWAGFADADNAKEVPLTVDITAEAWRHAKGGDYTGNITFTATLNTK